MWERVHMQDVEYVGEVATGYYSLGGYCLVCVMRPALFGPPYLGFKLGYLPGWLLRQRDRHIDALHELLGEPLFLAEADLANPKARRFLAFLGFVPVAGADNLYQRSQ